MEFNKLNKHYLKLTLGLKVGKLIYKQGHASLHSKYLAEIKDSCKNYSTATRTSPLIRKLTNQNAN